MHFDVRQVRLKDKITHTANCTQSDNAWYMYIQKVEGQLSQVTEKES